MYQFIMTLMCMCAIGLCILIKKQIDLIRRLRHNYIMNRIIDRNKK